MVTEKKGAFHCNEGQVGKRGTPLVLVMLLKLLLVVLHLLIDALCRSTYRVQLST